LRYFLAFGQLPDLTRVHEDCSTHALILAYLSTCLFNYCACRPPLLTLVADTGRRVRAGSSRGPRRGGCGGWPRRPASRRPCAGTRRAAATCTCAALCSASRPPSAATQRALWPPTSGADPVLQPLISSVHPPGAAFLCVHPHKVLRAPILGASPICHGLGANGLYSKCTSRARVSACAHLQRHAWTVRPCFCCDVQIDLLPVCLCHFQTVVLARLTGSTRPCCACKQPGGAMWQGRASWRTAEESLLHR
jgi:hypothetical protein